MLSHIFLGINNFNHAFKFYSAIMGELGLQLRFCDEKKPWAAWVSPDVPRPLFLIDKPFDGNPATTGNGQMVALLAPSRDAVDCAYQQTLAHGGSSEGAPGLRPEYHANYYGAYFRDGGGNKICVCCHDAVVES